MVMGTDSPVVLVGLELAQLFQGTLHFFCQSFVSHIFSSELTLKCGTVAVGKEGKVCSTQYNFASSSIFN